MVIKNIFLNVFISVFFVLISLYLYDRYTQKKEDNRVYYVVDVEKLYMDKQDRLKELVESGASEDEIEAYQKTLISYVKKTENYLSKLSLKNNIVIFNKKAIFSKVRIIDLTEKISNAID